MPFYWDPVFAIVLIIRAFKQLRNYVRDAILAESGAALYELLIVVVVHVEIPIPTIGR